MAIGIPLLSFTGYAHYKRTKAYRSETDIWIESNPYQARLLLNTQLSLELNMKITAILLKLSSKKEISENEIDEIRDLQSKFLKHMDKRTISNKKDQAYFKENYKL